MKADDFHKTAKLLNCHSNEEANIRTSINRSYYGAFLYFREYLKDNQVRKTKEPDKRVHFFVRETFRNSNSTAGSRVAEILSDLQEKRHQADYDLEEVFTPDDSEEYLEIAEKVISDYNQIDLQEKSKLLRNAKTYVQLKWC